MPLLWLWRPDDISWIDNVNYSPPAATAMRAAFGRVAPPATPNPEDFLLACELIAPWLGRQMAARQRVRACFLFANTLEAERAYVRAITWIDEALNVAGQAKLIRELAELLSYRGKLLRAREKFRAAAEDLSASLALLSVQAGGDEAIDPALRVELLSQLATYQFFLRHYSEAARAARKARLVAAHVPAMKLESATALWVEAQIERTRGKSERALLTALTVAEVYEREASTTSQDRIQGYVAELALDLVGKVPGGSESDAGRAYLTLAHKRIQQAERLARQTADRPGLGLVQLSRARESRLQKRAEDRVTSIERIIRTAQQLDDEGLLTQALTVQGDELAFLGETEQALNRYRGALDTVAGSEVPALGDPARRALLLASEMHV